MNPEIEKQITGRFLRACRYWNNSMGFYEDSAICLNDDLTTFEVRVGEDVWDNHVRYERILAQTPKELLERYQAKIEADERARLDAIKKREEAEVLDLEKKAEATHKMRLALRLALTVEEYPRVLRLLVKAKSPKASGFQKSMAAQVLKWVDDPKHMKPLSPRQMTFLK